jgi:hypothetical protein
MTGESESVETAAKKVDTSGNFGFIKICYGVVGAKKDTSKMTVDQVVEEFLRMKGVSSAKEYFAKQKENTYAKQRSEVLSAEKPEDKKMTKQEIVEFVKNHNIIYISKGSKAGTLKAYNESKMTPDEKAIYEHFSEDIKSYLIDQESVSGFVNQGERRTKSREDWQYEYKKFMRDRFDSEQTSSVYMTLDQYITWRSGRRT